MTNGQTRTDKTAPSLHRGLKNRHIQLIALGGAVGTGLFLGIAQSIALAGPAVLLGYGIAGLVSFFIMRQLAEMVVDEPVSGSFSHFAGKYCGDVAGYIAGWNYWTLYVLVSMAELSAVGVYLHYWWPHLPTWVAAAICFVLINGLNLLHVKAFGEVEFWFALIKVSVILAMIAFGGWLLFSGQGGPQASVANLWRDGGFFPHGVGGLVGALAIIIFSFGGLELVGITAAEAEDPGRSIPKATNQVIYRILVFYVGALAILLALYPWRRVAIGDSPFVMIFGALGNRYLADVLNLVVLSAALSVYNSCVYANSRMLHGMAGQGRAPRWFGSVDRRGIPFAALGVSAAATAICVVLNYVMPGKALALLMALVVSALMINWAMISVTHWRFRRCKAVQGKRTTFRSIGYPLTNLVTLAFMALVLVVLWRDAQTRLSVWLIPLWLAALTSAYLIRRRRRHASGVHRS
ncbi:aromatic amino acid transporter [Robbsia andropogonis]|uniref:Aromatic amino acid transporter n=1 Tax=Robbsia andropogonis TaxID=28092 RepID=A0A0F5JV70_9BURK|nr:amino acid permease [Robbsia andropogonis]KKB61758.1 aromatic amino acid transporter [Robbsia andropogonis]